MASQQSGIRVRQITNVFNTLITSIDNTEEEGRENHPDSQNRSPWKEKTEAYRHWLRENLHRPLYHQILIGLVIFDLVVIFVDLIVSTLNLPCYTDEQLKTFNANGGHSIGQPSNCLLPDGPPLTKTEWFLWSMSIFLLFIFAFDILCSVFAFGLRRFKNPIFTLDALVIVASLLMEFIFKLSPAIVNGNSSPAAMILMRLWKIIRAIHAVAHSIELKNQKVIREIREAKLKVTDELQLVGEKLQRLEIKSDYMWERLDQKDRDGEEMERYVDKILAELQSRDISEIV